MSDNHYFVEQERKRFFLLSPSQVLVLGFAIVILIGALILTLPQTSTKGDGLSFLDALFTATSATCVTGLIVTDTGTHFNTFGQIVVILLIQIGGLGFMSMSLLMSMLLGQKIGLRSRILAKESFNQLNLAGIVKMTQKVLAMTLTIELIGAVILTLAWMREVPFSKAVYYGIFHSISAFCNAGFDLMGNYSSITAYQNDWLIPITIACLIILGGLGFTVINEVCNYRRQKYLSLHTKMVLQVTGWLILVGTVLIFFLELQNGKTIANLSLSAKIINSFFQSVTCRTAGYNTLPLGEMTTASLFIMVILMFIGASPGSTGGGIKTSTFGSMLLAIKATIYGQEDIEYSGKRISREIVRRAFALTALALFLIVVATLIMSLSESHINTRNSFLKLLFEVVSAFGTVGLSTGITPTLTPIGKMVLIAMMFIGRLGPLTIAVALAVNKKKKAFRYPEDRIIVG